MLHYLKKCVLLRIMTLRKQMVKELSNSTKNLIIITSQMAFFKLLTAGKTAINGQALY